METQTQTTESTTLETVVTEQVQAEPELVAEVEVEGVEVAVTDTAGGMELSPASGLLVALVLSVVALVVVRLRKKG